MTTDDPAGQAVWADATLAVALIALDPTGLGGVNLRALAGPVRDHWLQLLRERLPPVTPLRRIPLGISDGRLLGGLDLAATLNAGRPVAEHGILREADGGIVILAMAERLPQALVAKLTSVLDTRELLLERDGFAMRTPIRLGVIALDEGMNEEEKPPAALLDRLALHIDLSRLNLRDMTASEYDAEQIAAAAQRLTSVSADDTIVEALCAAALHLGIESLRAPVLALRAARAAAALAGRSQVTADDAVTGARLVLAPRAVRLPEMAQEPEPDAPDDEPAADQSPDDTPADDDNDRQPPPDLETALDDMLLNAARTALPQALLEQLKLTDSQRSRQASAGRAGVLRQTMLRGRPVGTRKGEPRPGVRLNIVETLRAAAPWQNLRRRSRQDHSPAGRASPRVEVRHDDFRVTRFKQRSQTTTIFVVDASGSAALQRLAEAKGAIELLLADCYVRRDQVALLAFRGNNAELLLAPTRSLLRAKRSLAALPGGGGTPLATAIDAAVLLAETVQRRGDTPVVVFLTDGRANIARDGSQGRAQAAEEALVSARSLSMAGYTSLLIDISARPQTQAQRLAEAMNAHYLPLPHADAAVLSRAVQTVAATSSTPAYL